MYTANKSIFYRTIQGAKIFMSSSIAYYGYGPLAINGHNHSFDRRIAVFVGMTGEYVARHSRENADL